MEEIRYPIGRVVRPETITPAHVATWTEMVASAPGEMRAAVEGLTAEQLDTPYREGAWTLRQVVHHLADGQMHFFLRFRNGLVEDHPPVQPFDENLWAELPDVKEAPVSYSLAILEGVHARWFALMQTMEFSLFSERGMVHPDRGRQTLASVLNYGAWHAAHHTAQVAAYRKQRGW